MLDLFGNPSVKNNFNITIVNVSKKGVANMIRTGHQSCLSVFPYYYCYILDKCYVAN